MPLAPGTRLGPYEILAPLGAGGMGEVYTALDPKLGRKVALKILPDRLAEDPAALARFEREARALAALSHPVILAIFDFGQQEAVRFAVTELLEGRTLREAFGEGAMAPRRVAELGESLARGLAAAHDKGIVHRDIKPENLFLTRDGVKILDFGLARTEARTLAQAQATRGLDSALTGEGMLLGTVGYMSPEQVRGGTADARSDLFSLGVVLYEALAGKPLFKGASAVETLGAILKEEPPDWDAAANVPVPPALDRVVRHCLEKDPDRRFQSARDLAFALASLDLGAKPPVASRRPGRRRWLPALTGALALAAALAVLAFRDRAPLPTFQLLTHRLGTLHSARFIPGGPEILLSARWGDEPMRWYVQRLDQSGTRILDPGEGPVLSVSPAGEVLGLSDSYLFLGLLTGRLFSVPLSGGAPREWASPVWSASQGAQPGDLAVSIGTYGNEIRVEWPLGRVLSKDVGTARFLRIRGDHLVYFRETGDSLEDGNLVLADRSGRQRNLTALNGCTGLAWGADGREIWVSTFRQGQSRFLAVDLQGRTRPLLHHAGRLELQDVDADGRVLAALHSTQRQAFAHGPGDQADREIGWLDAQSVMSISADGTRVLLANLREWSLSSGLMYTRAITGGAARSVGPGAHLSSLSADGRWVMTTNEACDEFQILPTGPGTPRTFKMPEFGGHDFIAQMLPNGSAVVFWGRRGQEPFAYHALDLATGRIRQISPANANVFHLQNPLSPDGQWLCYNCPTQDREDGSSAMALIHPDGSGYHLGPVIERGVAVSAWGTDARSLILFNRNRLPAAVEKLDLATGRRTPLMTIQPPDPVGIYGLQDLVVAQDGRAYAYNVNRKISELYLIEGLK